MWRCSTCGRSFANRNQTHACGRHALENHFNGRPAEVRRLFHEFVRAAKASGPLIVLPEKTRIALQVRMSFAALMPRQSGLRGHLVLARRADACGFLKIETFSPRNHLHHFRLAIGEGIDARLRRFIAEAYRVGAQEHLRPLRSS